VNEVRFVPPFAVASVPATVTTPDVAAEGVSPVVPKPIVVTPPDEIDAVVTDVKIPLELTVITGTSVVEP
jgi:hypothetical protein